MLSTLMLFQKAWSNEFDGWHPESGSLWMPGNRIVCSMNEGISYHGRVASLEEVERLSTPGVARIVVGHNSQGGRLVPIFLDQFPATLYFSREENLEREETANRHIASYSFAVQPSDFCRKSTRLASEGDTVTNSRGEEFRIGQFVRDKPSRDVGIISSFADWNAERSRESGFREAYPDAVLLVKFGDSWQPYWQEHLDDLEPYYPEAPDWRPDHSIPEDYYARFAGAFLIEKAVSGEEEWDDDIEEYPCGNHVYRTGDRVEVYDQRVQQWLPGSVARTDHAAFARAYHQVPVLVHWGASGQVIPGNSEAKDSLNWVGYFYAENILPVD